MITRVAKYLLIAVVFSLSSCTKENLDDCFGGLKLDFAFTFHTNDKNLLDEKVQRVNVYFFDENDLLQLYAIDNGITLEYSFLQDGQEKSVTTPNPYGGIPNEYVMNLDQAPAGKYRIVSFAGSGMGDNTTFSHGYLNNSTTHDFTEGVKLGVTNTDEFRMFMKYNDAPNFPEDIVPIVDDIDDLFYGAVGTRDPITARYAMEQVEVKTDVVTQRHIGLIRNTNILKVTVSGLQFVDAATAASNVSNRQIDSPNYKLWVRAANGRYKFDDSPEKNGQSIRYSPNVTKIADNKLVADVKVLRLDMENRQAEPMWLYFESQNGIHFPQGGIDVVNTLLKAKDEQGNYIYTNPADFVEVYEHPIEIEIAADLSVKIFVNGWEIIAVIPDIDSDTIKNY